jgi:hypothetical protein
MNEDDPHRCLMRWPARQTLHQLDLNGGSQRRFDSVNPARDDKDAIGSRLR